MVNLPGTRPEMVASDFEGVTKALKGTSTILPPFWEVLFYTVYAVQQNKRGQVFFFLQHW